MGGGCERSECPQLGGSAFRNGIFSVLSCAVSSLASLGGVVGGNVVLRNEHKRAGTGHWRGRSGEKHSKYVIGKPINDQINGKTAK